MKILHTADWHLGKRLRHFSRLPEQISVLNEIIEIADKEDVDLVLIAGDLFDVFQPNTDAIDLFYKALKQLSNDGKRPIIAISGNHDAPNFIDAPNPLARACGIILIGHPKAIVQKFENEYFNITKSVSGLFEIQFKNENFPVRILHTPYANESRLKQYFGEDKGQKLNEVLAENWQELADEFCDNEGFNILLAHLYMNKKGGDLLEEPDGEKPIKIGNADLIYTDAIPAQVQYTALGHLHAYRNIGSDEQPVVYSSSPLCYSFSEAGQTKYVNILTVNDAKLHSLKKIALKAGRSLIRKSFSSVDETIHWLLENPDVLVEITLETDTFILVQEQKRIRQSHSGIMDLLTTVKTISINHKPLEPMDLSNVKPLFKDYFSAKNNGQEINDDLIELFNEILNSN